ncbi:MAG: hypothetical protein JW808_00505 [Victivallales bacterium]|nr:hypothetical protein [Victivallales bacterium]
MLKSLTTGLTFGITSAVITTLGLMTGLHSGTHSRVAVLGGILAIAIADSFSDALGIHISEEAEDVHTPGQIWTATVSTFLTKLVFALLFAIPVFLLPLENAVIVCLCWGLTLLGVLSYVIARKQKRNPFPIICEHILIALVVIFLSHVVGKWISGMD